jgi:hypothetical protein
MADDQGQDKSQPENPGPIVAYKVPANVYAAIMQTLQSLPYQQVANVMQACSQSVRPIHAAQSLDNDNQED